MKEETNNQLEAKKCMLEYRKLYNILQDIASRD